MLNFTATDPNGRQVVGTIGDRKRTRREVIVEFYERGYQRADIRDEQALVAGIATDPDGRRYWWASLMEPAIG